MAFDVYGLIKSEEIREYLRNNVVFRALEQARMIRNSYYSIEMKLEFLHQLLEGTMTSSADFALMEESVRLYEYMVDFIHNARNDAIYMSLYNVNGYSLDRRYSSARDNEYRLSESVIPDTHYFKTYTDLRNYWCESNIKWENSDRIQVDMVCPSELGTKYNASEISQPLWFDMAPIDGCIEIIRIGINEDYFIEKGFSEECVYDFHERFFRYPLPFETGCRVKFQTPAMLEPVFGIVDCSQDCYGCWYNFLLFENESHNASDIRQLIESGKVYDWEDIDGLDISFPVLEIRSEYLTYDWLERAEDQKRG